MVMIFDNDAELEIQLFMDLDEIVTEVSNQMLDILLESIQDEVYDAHGPGKEYYRRGYEGGFIGSWVAEENLEGAYIKNTIEMLIFSDASKLEFDPFEMYAEYDPVYNLADRSAYLDQVIADPHPGDWDFESNEYRDSEGEIPDWWMVPRDYWSPVIKLVDNGYLGGLIRAAFRKRNINFTVI